jgi:hypothetical protein
MMHTKDSYCGGGRGYYTVQLAPFKKNCVVLEIFPTMANDICSYTSFFIALKG